MTSWERYDVTGCEEATLTTKEGRSGVGLYASDGGQWRPSVSARWEPDAAQRTSLERFIGEVERLVDPTIATHEAPPMLLFRGAAGSEPAGHRFAVVGGRALFIVALDGDGRWWLVYMASDAGPASSPSHHYRPLAVFDMDGDGMPEIIYHEDHEDSWNDTVLRGEPDGGAWHRVASSVHSSTA